MTITFCVTQVKELMTPHPEMISPTATLQQAAKRMKSVKCGALGIYAGQQVEAGTFPWWPYPAFTLLVITIFTTYGLLTREKN